MEICTESSNSLTNATFLPVNQQVPIAHKHGAVTKNLMHANLTADQSQHIPINKVDRMNKDVIKI